MAVNERTIAATGFLSEFQNVSSKAEVHVSDLNIGKQEDFRLVVMSLLRGKTVKQYFDIVGGLFEAYDKAEGNKEEQHRLHTLNSTVMSIGEEVLGIDWS